MTAPTVSVIIPTYNRPQLLARAIRSVAAQTFNDYELLVVQNGGTRESEHVTNGFHSQIPNLRYLSEPVANPARARNVGMCAAHGRYLAFLEDDDLWIPEKLERQVQVLEEMPDVGMVTCRSWEVNLDGTVVGERPPEALRCDFKSLVTEDCGRLISSLSGVVLRKSCVDRIGDFKTSYRISGDVEFYLRVARDSRIHSMPEFLFFYTVHHANLSGNWLRGWIDVAKILHGLAPDESLGVSRDVLHAALLRYCQRIYRRAVDAFNAKRYREAARLYAVVLQLDPWIGNKIPWGRFSNPLYRLARPYGALAYSAIAALRSRYTKNETDQPTLSAVPNKALMPSETAR